jgi:flavin-dependent dehydrogenase
VLVTGDAAGLLEPWTREGISFALRSGRFAGEAAAKAAVAGSPAAADAALEEYVADVNRVLVPEMQAGRQFLTVFVRHTAVFHAGLATSRGQRLFARLCRSEITYSQIAAKPSVRRALALVAR